MLAGSAIKIPTSNWYFEQTTHLLQMNITLIKSIKMTLQYSVLSSKSYTRSIIILQVYNHHCTDKIAEDENG